MTGNRGPLEKVKFNDRLKPGTSNGCEAVWLREWILSDKCGHTVEMLQELHKSDKTPPSITLVNEVFVDPSDPSKGTELASGAGAIYNSNGSASRDPVEYQCGPSKFCRTLDCNEIAVLLSYCLILIVAKCSADP